MSADNGIYIVKFPDGYRVCYGAAIENIDYYPAGSTERKQELKSYFGASKLYANRGDAILAAHEMAADYSILEYGVCELGEREGFGAATLSPQLAEVSLPEPDGSMWSFLRKVLSQGGTIWLDHQDKSRELYSIRLDAAAIERETELALILRAYGDACAKAAEDGLRKQRSTSASDRLHNICDAIAEEADGSEWSREEWECVDAETARLHREVKELKAALASARVPAPGLLEVVDRLAGDDSVAEP